MRRLFVVLTLLSLMIGLRALQAETPQNSDPLTLAAIGFVVLAAFALAELGGRASLPRVTGYILSGVVLGPFAANIISQSVVVELKMFGTLALGLIATTAGLELDLRALVRLLRTLGTTIGIKIVLGIVLVGGALMVFEHFTHTLGLSNQNSILALALIFAALSLGTSPAIVLAVQSESKAKGRLSEVVLGAAVIKDVVVVIALAIALATAKALLGGGELGVDVLLHVGEELGVSVLAGSLLGGLLIAYLRWIQTEMLLFVAAMVLVVAEISAVLHLELLLVFIVAGMVVRNFSPYEHELLDPLQTISLPVFIVFFTNAGASIDLGATWALLPLALILCTARAVGYFVAARLGGRIGGEPEPVRRLAWLAYLPQAGVTLGLVGLAAKALPDLQEPIATLGMAVTAVNLLVGPVTLRIALRAAKETADSREATQSEQPEADPRTPDSQEVPTIESPALRKLLKDLQESLEGPWISWRNQELHEEQLRWQQGIYFEASPVDAESGVEFVQYRLDSIILDDSVDRTVGLLRVLAEQQRQLQALPVSLVVPLEVSRARVGPDDSWRTRAAKRWAWLGALLRGRRKRRIRQVSVRMSARTIVEPAMAQLAEQSLRDWQRYEIECLEVVERVALSTVSTQQLNAQIQELGRGLVDKLASNQRASIQAVLAVLGRRWAIEGAPGDRGSERYAQIERELATSIARLEGDVVAWPALRRAAVERLRFTTRCQLVEHRIGARIKGEVVHTLDDVFSRLAVLLEDQIKRLDGVPRSTALGDVDEQWSRVETQLHALLPKPVAKELRGLGGRVRRATASENASVELRAFMLDDLQQLQVIPSLASVARLARPAEVEIVTVNARELAEVQLADRLLPLLEECLSQAESDFFAVRNQMREVVSLVEFGLEAALRNRVQHEPTSPFDEALDRGRSMLESLQRGPSQNWDTTIRPRLLNAVDGMADQLCQPITEKSSDKGRPRAGGRSSRWTRVKSRLRREKDRVLEGIRVLGRFIRTGDVGQAAGDLALRYQLRVGLKRLDAQAIRGYLEEQRTLRESKLSGLVASLFSTEALRDPRLFVLNRKELSAIIRAERAWQAHSSVGNAALVIAPVGAGKSSILGIARLKLGTRRVLTIRRSQDSQDSAIGALCHALGVGPDTGALMAALNASPTVVVIDDLHHFFRPSLAGLRDLEQLIALILVSKERTFWLAAIAEESLRTWRSLVALDDVFPCSVRLGDFGSAELLTMLEARRELGGQRCVYPQGRGGWFSDVLRRSPQQAYIRRLTTAASGNLRRALALWGAHAQQTKSGTVTLQPLSILSWRLPFIQQLREEAQAILSLLMQHGAQPRETIAAALGLNHPQVEVHLRFLVASRLVGIEGERYAICNFVYDDMMRALGETGAIERGAR